MSKAECDANEVLRLQAKVERLEAEAAAMREALEAVEWVFRTGTGYCPWCEKPFKSGHAADCQRQTVLASDAGRDSTPGDRWREARWARRWAERDEARR